MCLKLGHIAYPNSWHQKIVESFFEGFPPFSGTKPIINLRDVHLHLIVFPGDACTLRQRSCGAYQLWPWHRVSVCVCLHLCLSKPAIDLRRIGFVRENLYPPIPAMARGSASGQRGCETTNNQQRATNSRRSSSSSQFLESKLDGALLFRICLLRLPVQVIS